MPRKDIPTGRPPGRPRKPVQRNRVTLVQRQMMAEELGLRTALAVQGNIQELAPLSPEDAANPVKVLEHQAASLIVQLYPQAMAAITTPGLLSHSRLVQTYLQLLEYKLPKLARVEQTGTVTHNHNVRTFVEVEKREEAPLSLSMQPDGTYAVTA